MATSPSSEQSRRSRLVYAACAAATLLLGLASRKVPHLVPAFLGKYPGDVLWATTVYFLFALAAPAASAKRLFAAALVFSLVIEFLKLTSAPWMVAIRASTAGALVFGHVFSWENIAAYAVGVAIGYAADMGIARRRKS